MHKPLPPDTQGFLAPMGLESCLEHELVGVMARYGRLFIAPAQNSYWAENIWLNPTIISIQSIKDGAQKLRHLQRNWCHLDYTLHRRSELIQEQLPKIKAAKPLMFAQDKAPTEPLGSWTLLDEKTLLASASCSSPVAHGLWTFVENKEEPPSRAYLKLWECFTRLNCYPKATDVCVDLGASPGGWTWVLAQLSHRVLAYDRSPLAPALMNNPKITCHLGDAFKFSPQQHPGVTWVCSDIVAYPDKLFTFVSELAEKYHHLNLVFTIKFQGESGYGVIPQFAAIPHSQILHLSHNKHELTWVRLSNSL